MSHSALDLAMKAMDCPQALEILNSIHRLGGTGINYSSPVSKPKTNFGTSLPRLSELEMYGVNSCAQRLIQVASQYPERLPSAINAWLNWISYTEVEYPTGSLVKAIEQNWKIKT